MSAPLISGLSLLQNKREAELSGGAFARGQVVSTTALSRYAKPADGLTTLGMGYLQAVLSVLLGVVSYAEASADGTTGHVWLRSTRGGTASRMFSWHDSAARIVMGGFSVYTGTPTAQPTYQAAVVGLVDHVMQHLAGERVQTDELLARWNHLVGLMNSHYPRTNPDVGWDKESIEAACRHTVVAPAIERVTHSLMYALQYALSSKLKRDLLVTDADVLVDGVAKTRALEGKLLLQPLMASTAAAATPAAAPAAIAAPTSPPKPSAATASAAPPAGKGTPPSSTRSAPHTDTDRGIPEAPTAPSPPPSAPPSTPPVPAIHGPYVARIRRALVRPGAKVFLVGPTATGKTFQAIESARWLGYGIEQATLDPGKDALELIGGYARALGPARATAAGSVEPVEWLAWEDVPTWARVLNAEVATVRRLAAQSAGGWEAVDGPITRWARRAIAGEQVVLIIDELARGHTSVVSLVMGIMNSYDRDAITRQGLALPDGCDDCPSFHLVDVWMTKERLVVPTTRVRIIATSNLGDKYLGQDLSDPAFRRRWDAWLYLGAYEADIQQRILSEKLALSPSAPLPRAMLTVAGAVETYQREEERLDATLDLATLITWGVTALALVESGAAARAAFVDAAQDTWVERLCPLKGATLDPDVRAKLLGFVTTNAPSSLR